MGVIMTISAHVKNYVGKPMIMSLDAEIKPAWDTPFPAITICSENQYYPSLIDFPEIIKKVNRTSDDVSKSTSNNYNSNSRYLKKKKKKATVRKPPLKGRKWKDLRDNSIAGFLKYCEMTTLHGLRYLAEPHRPLYERIFWLLALALVYTGMTITITAQVRNYLSNPVLMSLNGEITPTWDIPFPAITICSENQINPSLINFTELINKQNRTIEEQIKLNLGVRICTDYIQSFVNEHLLKMMHDLSNDELLDSEANMKISLKMGTALCKRIIKSFSWQNIRRTNPCAYLQMFSTKAGICFTFNMLPISQLFSQEYIEELAPTVYDELTNIPYKFYLSDRIWELESGYKEINFDENSIPWRTPGVSYDNSATFVLDFLSDDMDENCIQGGHGFWTAVHNPAEPPTPYQTVAYAETDATTIFKISPQLTSTSENLRLWTPEARGCYYSHERKLKFYSTYTLHNCDIECEADMIYNECNCSVNVLSHRISTPLCGIHQVDCLKKVIIRFSSRQQDSKHFSACNCLPACTEITYDMEFSSLPMLFEDPSSNISKNATKKGNIAVVTYLFKTNSVSNIQRVAIVTISDFIANIGGLMGLFLGFSFISLFEVIYFMTARWATDVWNNRRI